jgi:crotonobetainyl-CoA:carnitine CoA-transferase CaiB-like acyl-CoA transferase
VSVVEHSMWGTFVEVLGSDLLRQPGFETFAKRNLRRDVVNAEIQLLVGQRTSSELIEAFDNAGVPWAPVNTPQEALEDPIVQAMGVLHQEPVMHATLPIRGLASRRNVVAPELDADGDLVRRDGWRGLLARQAHAHLYLAGER